MVGADGERSRYSGIVGTALRRERSGKDACVLGDRCWVRRRVLMTCKDITARCSQRQIGTKCEQDEWKGVVWSHGVPAAARERDSGGTVRTERSNDSVVEMVVDRKKQTFGENPAFKVNVLGHDHVRVS